MLVTADRLPGAPVDRREPAKPTPGQDLVDRGRGQAGPFGDLHRPEPVLPAKVPKQLHSTPGGLHVPRSFRSCRHTTSTNVPDQYI